MSRGFLSIDWDFFPYNGFHEQQQVVLDGKPDIVPGDLLYDWGHSEAWSASLLATLWQVRAEGFVRCGLDIEHETRLRLDPQAVLDELRAREANPIFQFYSDSHAWAGPVCRDLSQQGDWPFRVLSFDAHHDLGYNHARDSDSLDCGNWLGQALDRGWAESATIVYPDWLHKLDYDREAWEGKVTVCSWTDWLNTPVGEDSLDIDAGFICRSSAWTPPWHDPAFTAFRKALFPHAMNLDAERQQVGAHDTDEERDWTPVAAVASET